MFARRSRIEILGVIGEGAFGTVCTAKIDTDSLQREVAIKVLKPELASDRLAVEQARREAMLLARIHHPGIVRVEQLVEVAGVPVVVMEWVRGLSLKDLLRLHKDGLPPAVALEAIRQVCTTLHDIADGSATAEPLALLHRDLKPSNLLLSIHGELKIVDFGIATAMEPEDSLPTHVSGSRPYMAPERATGAPDTPAVDVYSIGASLYELLTGRTLVLSERADRHDEQLEQALEALRLEALAPTLTRQTRALLRAMCAHAPAARPDARDIALRLAEVLTQFDSTQWVGLDTWARVEVREAWTQAKAGEPDAALRHLLESAHVELPSKAGAVDRRKAQRFFLTLAALVAALGGAAAVKQARRTTPADPEPSIVLTVRLPDSAHAHVGGVPIGTDGTIRIPPGPNRLELEFPDGDRWVCALDARLERELLYIEVNGDPAFTSNIGTLRTCAPASDDGISAHEP